MSAAAGMSTREYHEASWEAYDLQTPMPDPAELSNHALQAFVRYEAPDLLLPVDADEAVQGEWKRRGLGPAFVDQLVAIGVMVLLGVGGVVIGWALLVP